MLIDQELGDLNCKVPVIWLKTIKENQGKEQKQEDDNEDNDDEDESKIVYQYVCPAFKTSKRTSIISASGRSDEHIISIVSIIYFRN